MEKQAFRFRCGRFEVSSTYASGDVGRFYSGDNNLN